MAGSQFDGRSLHRVRLTVMKKYLFVMRQCPNISGRVQETLDQILTTAAFDQQVDVLFADDGVLQLKAGQHPQTLSFKQTAAVFQALEIYDVRQLWIESESMRERGLSLDDLILRVEPIDRCDVGRLIADYDVTIPD